LLPQRPCDRGAISGGPREPGLFTDSQVKSFRPSPTRLAIAVENVRLFKELEARTAT